MAANNLNNTSVSASNIDSNKGKRWTEKEEAQLDSELYNGCSMKRMAANHGRTVLGIQYRAGKILAEKFLDIIGKRVMEHELVNKAEAFDLPVAFMKEALLSMSSIEIFVKLGLIPDGKSGLEKIESEATPAPAKELPPFPKSEPISPKDSKVGTMPAPEPIKVPAPTKTPPSTENKCKYTFKKGFYSGEMCGNQVVPGTVYCRLHEDLVEERSSVTVVIKAVVIPLPPPRPAVKAPTTPLNKTNVSLSFLIQGDKHCKYVFRTGPSKGEVCGSASLPLVNLCKRHVAARSEVDDELKKLAEQNALVLRIAARKIEKEKAGGRPGYVSPVLRIAARKIEKEKTGDRPGYVTPFSLLRFRVFSMEEKMDKLTKTLELLANKL